MFEATTSKMDSPKTKLPTTSLGRALTIVIGVLSQSRARAAAAKHSQCAHTLLAAQNPAVPSIK